MAKTCFVKCWKCTDACPYLYKNPSHCRIGRIKMKDGADLKILPTRTIGLTEQLFRAAIDYACNKEIAAAGYFIVTVEGKVFTHWVVTEHTKPSDLHGGASMLAHDILRAGEPPPTSYSPSA